MSRQIIITPQMLQDVANAGGTLVVPVRVDWPELQLTDHQIQINNWATLENTPPPHLDPVVELVFTK